MSPCDIDEIKANIAKGEGAELQDQGRSTPRMTPAEARIAANDLMNKLYPKAGEGPPPDVAAAYNQELLGLQELINAGDPTNGSGLPAGLPPVFVEA